MVRVKEVEDDDEGQEKQGDAWKFGADDVLRLKVWQLEDNKRNYYEGAVIYAGPVRSPEEMEEIVDALGLRYGGWIGFEVRDCKRKNIKRRGSLKYGDANKEAPLPTVQQPGKQSEIAPLLDYMKDRDSRETSQVTHDREEQERRERETKSEFAELMKVMSTSQAENNRQMMMYIQEMQKTMMTVLTTSLSRPQEDVFEKLAKIKAAGLLAEPGKPQEFYKETIDALRQGLDLGMNLAQNANQPEPNDMERILTKVQGILVEVAKLKTAQGQAQPRTLTAPKPTTSKALAQAEAPEPQKPPPEKGEQPMPEPENDLEKFVLKARNILTDYITKHPSTAYEKAAGFIQYVNSPLGGLGNDPDLPDMLKSLTPARIMELLPDTAQSAEHVSEIMDELHKIVDASVAAEPGEVAPEPSDDAGAPE